MAIVMALLSGFAGVYTENFWLYVFGMGFNAIAILIQDFDAVMNKGFFHGYSLITTLMILNHALSGIAVSMVMKYADNIVKVYSTSVAMLLTAVFSVFLFGFHLSLAFFLGSTIVSVSVYLHCWEGTKIVMTLRLSQIALSMYRLIFCNIFVSFLFFQLIFLNLPVQSICLDNT
ncbi:unnamed protein product [Camellia sinensis]